MLVRVLLLALFVLMDKSAQSNIGSSACFAPQGDGWEAWQVEADDVIAKLAPLGDALYKTFPRLCAPRIGIEVAGDTHGGFAYADTKRRTIVLNGSIVRLLMGSRSSLHLQRLVAHEAGHLFKLFNPLVLNESWAEFFGEYLMGVLGKRRRHERAVAWDASPTIYSLLWELEKEIGSEFTYWLSVLHDQAKGESCSFDCLKASLSSFSAGRATLGLVEMMQKITVVPLNMVIVYDSDADQLVLDNEIFSPERDPAFLRGDRIVTIAGENVATVGDVARAVNHFVRYGGPGQIYLPITVERGGALLSKRVFVRREFGAHLARLKAEDYEMIDSSQLQVHYPRHVLDSAMAEKVAQVVQFLVGIMYQDTNTKVAIWMVPAAPEDIRSAFDMIPASLEWQKFILVYPIDDRSISFCEWKFLQRMVFEMAFGGFGARDEKVKGLPSALAFVLMRMAMEHAGCDWASRSFDEGDPFVLRYQISVPIARELEKLSRVAPRDFLEFFRVHARLFSRDVRSFSEGGDATVYNEVEVSSIVTKVLREKGCPLLSVLDIEAAGTPCG